MRLALTRRLRRRAPVTVVIPCYNYGHYLPEAVGSALEQERVDVRVVIVDDASPDGSVDVARRLERTDDRVTVIAHDENRGLMATLNDGLSRVETDYVAAVSADDLLAPGALARACALMDSHPRVGLVQGKAVIFTNEEGPHPEGFTSLNVWTVWSGEDWIEHAARLGRNLIMSPEAVMRTTALRDVGGYDPRMPHTSDLHMWLRTAARWDVGWLRGVVQAYYRNHGANMHSTYFGTDAADLSGLLDAFADLSSPAITATLPRGPELARIASVSIGRRALEAAAVAAAEGRASETADLVTVAVRADPALKSRADEILAGTADGHLTS